MLLLRVLGLIQENNIYAAPLKAGAAKVNITDVGSRLINDSLYVKAVILDDGVKL